MSNFLDCLIGNIDLCMCKNIDNNHLEEEDMHEAHILKRKIIRNYYQNTQICDFSITFPYKKIW